MLLSVFLLLLLLLLKLEPKTLTSLMLMLTQAGYRHIDCAAIYRNEAEVCCSAYIRDVRVLALRTQICYLVFCRNMCTYRTSRVLSKHLLVKGIVTNAKEFSTKARCDQFAYALSKQNTVYNLFNVFVCQLQIGSALKKLFEDGVVKREELFITSKLWSVLINFLAPSIQ